MYRLILPALLAASLLPETAAAETNDCTPIASLPAVVTSQGIFCLTADLSTGITSGAAITLANNNITLDCNGFKIGGLAGGPETAATGVQAINRSNITLRNCNIRGFMFGVEIDSTLGPALPVAGHIVEDNRLDGITARGISVNAVGSVVRRNLVIDTGGNPHTVAPIGITVRGATDVVDNTVDGVFESFDTSSISYGYWILDSSGSAVVGNRARNVTGSSTRGFYNSGPGDVVFRGNFASSSAGEGHHIGFLCISNVGTLVVGNASVGFGTAYAACVDGGGNTQLLPDA